MKLKVELCPLAKRHHLESGRQFAHVFHRKNTICVTPEFYNLPQVYRVGILLHELGHVALQEGTDHSEAEADGIITILCGIRIHRRTYRGLKRLEVIERAQMSRAMDFLEENLTR